MKKVRNLLAAALVLAMGTVQASAFAAPTVDLKDPIGTKTSFSDLIKNGSYPYGTSIVNFNKEDGMYFDVGPTVAVLDEGGNPVTDEGGNAVTEVKNDTFDGTTKYLHIPKSSTGNGRTIGVGDGWYHYSNESHSYPNMSKDKVEFDIRIPKQLEFTNSDLGNEGFIQIDTEVIDENNLKSDRILKTKGYYVQYNAETGIQTFMINLWDGTYVGALEADKWYHIEICTSIPDDKYEVSYWEYVNDGQAVTKQYKRTASFPILEKVKGRKPAFGEIKGVMAGARILINPKIAMDITDITYWRDEFAIKTPEVNVTDTKVNASVKVANNAFLTNWYYNQNTDLEAGVGYKLKSTQSPVFIFAQYGSDGELLDVTYKTQEIAPVNKAFTSSGTSLANIAAPTYEAVSAEMDKKAGYDHMKVFVWDNTWKLIPYRGVFSTAAAE